MRRGIVTFQHEAEARTIRRKDDGLPRGEAVGVHPQLEFAGGEHGVEPLAEAVLGHHLDTPGGGAFVPAEAAAAEDRVVGQHGGGGAQRGAGYFDQAEVAWKKALALDSRMADAWFNLGILYLENPNAKRDRLQQLNDAVNGFNAYKRIGGKDSAVDKYLEEAATLIKQETENRQNQLKTPTPDG